MKCFSYVSIAAGLVCCLAASPARADLATPDAGSAEAPVGQVLSALQALTGMMDAASLVSGNSTLASSTHSTGPATGPVSSKGIDSSNGPVSTVAMAADSAGSIGLFAAAATAVPGESSPAAPPVALLLGNGSIPVGTPSAPSTDLSSMASSVSSPLLDSANQPLVAPVPLPASFLMLGGGLVGLFSRRRCSARLYPAV